MCVTKENERYLATSGDGTGGRTAGDQWPLALVVFRLAGGSLDAGRGVRPGAVVERLLLAPQNVGVGVLVEVRRELYDPSVHMCI